MKLFSFPTASLEKAIFKRIATLPSPHKEWFVERWQQKPYKKAFIDNKAMPLVTLVAKGKTWDEPTFAEAIQDWDVAFYEAEAEVLRPLIQGDGLLQLMQKNLPPERAQALIDKLKLRREAAQPPSSPLAAETTID